MNTTLKTVFTLKLLFKEKKLSHKHDFYLFLVLVSNSRNTIDFISLIRTTRLS